MLCYVVIVTLDLCWLSQDENVASSSLVIADSPPFPHGFGDIHWLRRCEGVVQPRLDMSADGFQVIESVQTNIAATSCALTHGVIFHMCHNFVQRLCSSTQIHSLTRIVRKGVAYVKSLCSSPLFEAVQGQLQSGDCNTDAQPSIWSSFVIQCTSATSYVSV